MTMTFFPVARIGVSPFNGSQVAAVLLGEKRHRQLDAPEVFSRDLEITGDGGADGQENGVVPGAKLVGIDRPADLSIEDEADPLPLKLVDPPLDVDLGHLEVGDAVGQQPPCPVVALVDGHRVAGAAELLGRGQPGGPAADDCHRLAGLTGRWPGDDPAHLPAAIDDGRLDLLDGHRGAAQRQHTGRLARRGTGLAREFGEIVRVMQRDEGFLPAIPVNQFVPVGNQVTQRAAAVAKRHAAVHAAGGLSPHTFRGHRLVELVEVLDPLVDRAGRRLLLLDVEESAGVSHERPPQRPLQRASYGGWDSGQPLISSH